MKSENSDRRLQIPDPNKHIVISTARSLSTNPDLLSNRIIIRPANHILLPTSWNKIPALHKTRGVNVLSPEELVHLVELPLYKACFMLYSAGIKTTESNAHFPDGSTETNIVMTIVWDTLSPLQRNAALKLCVDEPDKWKHLGGSDHPDGFEALCLNWKINRNQTSPQQVNSYAVASAVTIISGRVVIT